MWAVSDDARQAPVAHDPQRIALPFRERDPTATLPVESVGLGSRGLLVFMASAGVVLQLHRGRRVPSSRALAYCDLDRLAGALF